MKKRKMLLSCILCLTLVVFSFIGCTDASVKNSCVRIAIQYVNYDPLLEKGEDLEVKRNSQVKAQEEYINRYLQEKGYEYTVDLEVTFNIEEEEIKEYNLIYGAFTYTSKELSERYRDLSEELKEDGKLKEVYQSIPEIYWETVKVNGAVYSIIRSFANRVDSLLFPKDFENMQLSIPEECIGASLQEWEDFFETIYQKNGQESFLLPPFTSGYADMPVMPGLGWSAHFQLITPYIGIAYDEPELGPQLIYQSQYAKEIIRTWQKFAECGYINLYNFDQLYISPMLGYDVIPQQEEVRGCYYPMQQEIYAAPQLLYSPTMELLIPKENKGFDLTCQFLNDIANDIELSRVVCLTEQGESFLRATPTADMFFEIGQNSGLFGTEEENKEQLVNRLKLNKEAPLPGFVFDWTEVEKEYIEIEGYLASNPLSILSSDLSVWGNWESYIQDMIDTMYELGLQAVLDEVQRQIEVYNK